MAERTTQHICNKEDAIDKMSEKLDDIHASLFSDEDGPSISGRIRALEELALQIKEFLIMFNKHELRINTLENKYDRRMSDNENKLNSHIENHKLSDAVKHKWLFWAITTIGTIGLTALVTYWTK